MKRVKDMTDDEVRDLCGSGDYPEHAARDAADRVAETVRLLNYLSLPHDGAPGLTYPGDMYDIVASLKVAVQRMPQLFQQLSLWLGEQYALGNVGHDSRQDPAPYVAKVREFLDTGIGPAEELERALNVAHNYSSGLMAST